MAVTIQNINLGTVAGDGTGDKARAGGQKINDNFAAVKAAVDLVLDIPQDRILGRVTASTGDAEVLTPTQVRTMLELQQNSGFIDRADSTISVVDGTRTVTIAPTGASFSYWETDTKYTKSSSENIQFTDVEGLHFIYYDGPTLIHTTTFSDLIITEYAFVCVIYWDATNNQSIIFGDERHGHLMDSATHLYNHHTFGARYADGLGIGNINTGGTGNVASDAQFSVASGAFWDEDIELVITDGSPQTLSIAAEIPILYRSGATGLWRRNAATTYPVAVGATPLVQWNEWTGATWQLTEANSGNYVLYHYYATNDTRHPIVGIPGQAQYSSLANAQAAAPNEINELSTGQLELLGPEIIPIATVIWETRTSFTNAVSARTRPTEDGNDYIDWRGTSGSGSGGSGGGGTVLDPTAIHDNIGTEIQPITVKGTPVSADVLLIEDSTASYAKKSITIGTIPHNSLSGYVAAEHIDWSVTGAEDVHVDRITSGAITQHEGDITITESQISDLTHYTHPANHPWSILTGTPTTLSGYGISDTKANFNTSLSDGSFLFVGDPPTAHTHTESEITDIGTHTHTFASLTSKPTTLAGYGISDTTTNFNSALSNGSFAFAGGAFHDGFSDYVADEHIDWTADQGVTDIHPNNYTNTTYSANDFNHDDLANVPANDHIDWTADQGATNIHSGNYTDTVYSHPNHTGHVTSTGDGATVLTVAAITGQTALESGLVGTDELLVSDAGVIKRMDVSVMNAYFNANLAFNNYTHPTHPGDDFSVDTGALTGATVVSDIDINVTTDTEGHVTDANGTVATRVLTLANLGYTGATDANNYSHPNHTGQVTSTGDGATALTASAITAQTALASGLAGTDELLVSDGGVLKRMDVSVMNAYFNANLSFNNYTHPTHPGDDFSVDTGALTGAVVVSDIDINVTTDTLGHVTDANGVVSTRSLTAADIGALSTTGTAAKVTVTNSTAAANYPVVWHNNSNQLYDTVSNFYFHPSTGRLYSTFFRGTHEVNHTNALPASNLAYTGIVEWFEANGTITAGYAVSHVTSSAGPQIIHSDADIFRPPAGVAISGGAAGALIPVLTKGYIYLTGAQFGGVAGSIVYLSSTAGYMTSTHPSGASDYVWIMGFCQATDHLYVNPQLNWVQNA